MSKLFRSVNEIDPHKKSRQLDLALENYWVTQCGWIWSCNIFDNGMNLTSLLKLFHYGVKREYHEKYVGMRELLEKIALDCFNDTFLNFQIIIPLSLMGSIIKIWLLLSGYIIWTYISHETQDRNVSDLNITSDSSPVSSLSVYTLRSHHTVAKS